MSTGFNYRIKPNGVFVWDSILKLTFQNKPSIELSCDYSLIPLLCPFPSFGHFIQSKPMVTPVDPDFELSIEMFRHVLFGSLLPLPRPHK